MKGGERGTIADEVGRRLFELLCQQGLPPLKLELLQARNRKLRDLAVAQVAEGRGLAPDTVSAMFDTFGGDGKHLPKPQGGRPVAYTDSAAAKADRLAQLLLWSFKRLPANMCPDAPANRISAAVDALALITVPADKADLSRLRRGKRLPNSARTATAKTALLLSRALLLRVMREADDLNGQLTNRHRAIVTPVCLRGAAFKLLRLAEELSARKRRAEAAARRAG
ncbi:hypothetical protein LMG23992_00245 [Cupriavidus laharis]|uniref:Uncharacterized protein n=1 Tax=Cupriavidus laharis TaxID=151654 RepID=A0ABM8WCS2_9BURK|nr:hypothetical protein [Cupriavidus laharis]CAG9165098.1 hypothetical protein LMG23992_00245 [Cupriavidus laharis]